MNNNKYTVKNGLIQVGEKVYLKDGNWISIPFYAVLSPKWRSNKSDFEPKETEIGTFSADYNTYIGKIDHNILSLSDDAYLITENAKFVFKKRDSVKMGNKVLFYRGILRKV